MDEVCYWLRSAPENKTTFLGARKVCREEGGDVALIPSQAVVDALFPGTTG